MITLFIIGAPLLVCCVWIFFKKLPQNARKSYVLIYNFISFFVILFLAFYFGYNSYKNIINTVDSNWALVTVSISFSFVFLVGIILAFIIRNFLLFKNRK